MAITQIHNNGKKYYELLSSIAFENGYDINGCGFVSLSVPFKWAQDAVKYAMLKLPDIKKDENPVIQNKAQCRQLSGMVLPEVERLIMCIEQIMDESTEKLASLARQRDEKSNELLGRVERDVLQENIIQQIGYNLAMHDVWKMLSKRKYELWECSRLRD